jgi:hypothetical protein
LIVVLPLNVMAQVAAPPHDPLQPPKVEPLAGVATSVTDVPAATVRVHVEPQEIPGGELATVPAPLPLLVTDNVTGAGAEATATPLTLRETVSPAAVKITLAANVPTLVGRNRTVTV